MALSDINQLLLKPTGNGYETLRDAIKSNKLKKITKRDALFLINKQMEGVSETRGNLYIYMYYFSCTDPGGRGANSPTWYLGVKENDDGAGGGTNESTAWCGCYTSFALNWSGISPKGHYGSNGQAKAHNLTQNTDFSTAKTMDLIQYGASGAGHTCFLLKEDTSNPNDYKSTKRNGLDLPFYQFGGNQGDSVNISRPSTKRLNGFYSNSKYDEKISSGDMLSVLAYFFNANLKTVEQRKKEINARLESNVSIGTPLEKEVRETRALIGESSDSVSSGYYLGTGDDAKDFRERFKELIIFEQSLIDGDLPLTQNITGKVGCADCTR